MSSIVLQESYILWDCSVAFRTVYRFIIVSGQENDLQRKEYFNFEGNTLKLPAKSTSQHLSFVGEWIKFEMSKSRPNS